MENSIRNILYSENEIKTAVEKLGKQITKDFQGKDLVVICVLKGSVLFFSDLIRSIKTQCKVDFIGASSYGSGTCSSGVIRIYKDLDLNIENRSVIIVEDILDTARTMDYLVHMLMEKHPAELKICTLLDKQARRCANVEADYKCFDIGDEFVVGYGLDYNEDYRHLPYIGILEEEVYQA